MAVLFGCSQSSRQCHLDYLLLLTDCEQGVFEACDGLTHEQEAKKQWLAKMDAPRWGAVTAAVASVASAVTFGGGGPLSAGEIAKQKWIASADALYR